ncbi:uncharacterized protein BJX67DRAFT_377988 [Aspergillus lucknowensis]|uniref:Uncharacterized protein n=1 Tax=Aspergillus lucknowensis TaxID=176173 RepID=A0ABR4M1G1_9EURO
MTAGVPCQDLTEIGIRGRQLEPLLLEKNGFYAYGPALLVRLLGRGGGHPRQLDDENLFFAENIFGFRFAHCPSDCIYQFDSETSDRGLMGKDVYEWASTLMGDLDFYIRRASVAGAERPAASLDTASTRGHVELMRFRGNLHTQTKDGAAIQLSVD